jgi:hypothetical protein
MDRFTAWMGEPGGRWALARVFLAMLIVAVVGGVLGYVFDLVVGPLIGQSGWWTVTFAGGAIAGATAQAVREFAVPSDPSAYAHGSGSQSAARAAPGAAESD